MHYQLQCTIHHPLVHDNNVPDYNGYVFQVASNSLQMCLIFGRTTSDIELYDTLNPTTNVFITFTDDAQ